MNKISAYFSGALILAATLALLSCRKETINDDNGIAGDSQITVTATIENAATKVSFTEDNVNNKLKTSWEVGDNIVGWDADGHKIELTIADADKITSEGVAVFTTVSGSAAIPASGKVYMIYAPGKHYTDVGDKSLEYNLGAQVEKVPALMTATGTVTNNVLALTFHNELAIVALKNPTLPVNTATQVTVLQLSGDNVKTVAKLEMNGESLELTPSIAGDITRTCDFTTEANGTTANTMVYFAVLPASTPADITLSTINPAGYKRSFTGKSFTAGQCYMLDTKEIEKEKFPISIADGITNGTVSTTPEDECAWGETVSVNTEAAEGYAAGLITVTDANNNPVTVTGNTFIMPAKAVTVTVAFQ